MIKENQTTLNRLQVLLDMAIVLIAMAASYYIRFTLWPMFIIFNAIKKIVADFRSADQQTVFEIVAFATKTAQRETENNAAKHGNRAIDSKNDYA